MPRRGPRRPPEGEGSGPPPRPLGPCLDCGRPTIFALCDDCARLDEMPAGMTDRRWNGEPIGRPRTF